VPRSPIGRQLQTLYSVGIASVALGIARGMLDAFVELALRLSPI
jgi:hypothetical protein